MPDKLSGTTQHWRLTFSIVIPVFNEEESLPALFTELTIAMQTLPGPYEVIFVNDGSTDRSSQILGEFSRKFRHVRNLTLPQRSGQTSAMRKGLDLVHGNWAVTLDADLQNDPEDIPRLWKKMQEGFDVVCGWRKDRQDMWLKARLSNLGNAWQRLLTGFTIHDISCTLRMYHKSCVDKIPLNWEGQHRFIPLCLSLQGFKVGEIISHHRKRKFGLTKYSHNRIFKVIFDFFRILIHKGEK